MSVKVTFEFDTAADAAAFLQDFDAGGAPAGEGTVAGAAGKPRGRPRKSDAVAAVAPAAAPAAVASAAPAPSAAAPAASGNAVPFQAVADAITALADVSRDKAVALLGQFGVKLASELKPEQFAGIVAAAKQALAPAPTSLI